jgi:hypothetical protein
MSILALVFAIACGGPCDKEKTETQLAAISAAVRSADYRGDRGALEKLDAQLAKLPDSALDDYRAYWRGFARWRRALNGFNEKPQPGDLEADVRAAVAHFKSALAKRDNWIEARLALVGCYGNLIYLSGNDAEKKQAILAEAIPLFADVRSDTTDNPRVLWILGGLQMAAPPPTGGDPVKAAATLRKGVESYWKEASAAQSPAWAPAWGGAENLMNLAYLYSHSAIADKNAARAYAQGAVTAAPEWHYVRDVLLPQIEAMPETASAAPAAPSK